MSEDLDDEIQAINAIYGDDTLERDGHDDQETGSFILRLPPGHLSVRLKITPTYPQVPPIILGAHTAGHLNSKKGDANRTIIRAKTILDRTFQPGSVCLYEVLQELSAPSEDDQMDGESSDEGMVVDEGDGSRPSISALSSPADEHVNRPVMEPGPAWVISDEVAVKRSVFVGRCAHVTQLWQIRASIEHLTATDRRVGKATHNMAAWRIKGVVDDVSYQDCDDDGETAAGSRLLHLLQLMDVWNVLVVVSRWYGGIQLGPDR